ncbi:subtilisin-like protein [Mytilinidion resinicola]|uniref:tripeptidyl-peptidase II n=1 Tax=Mytilinidion resinicola TaxID=574789 RepID=A0A6A6YGC3_9PEZI|nr:subtilisin-like protein [Mytilinidion resinicola]KAF2807064.1 subtilisin-like protein [Mytilinidion resinicola]
MHFSITTIVAFVAVASALPASYNNHVVHEKRDAAPAKWVKRSKMDGSVHLPWLNEVSNPSSKKYGQHWSIEEINDAFAPSQESTDKVLEWLAEHGVTSAGKAPALHTLEFDMSIADIERLLKTEFFVYEHTESGKPHVACEEYSVPAHLREHIDIITPTLHFDSKPKAASKKLYGLSKSYKDTDVQSCVDTISPDCLRALYNIPDVSSTKPCGENSFGIVEYSDNSYISSDLDAFFANYSKPAVGSYPELVSIDGGVVDDSNVTDFGIHGESDLDFEYAIPLVYPQKVTLYQVGDGGFSPANASFIKTKVVSTSWGQNEWELTPSYERSLCNEYMKLGLAGVSVVFSTGDYGVAGSAVSGDKCSNGTNRFQPDFPATCPYVTAVGATMVDPSIKDLASVLKNGGQPEIAINHTVTTADGSIVSDVKSGGGFSDVFPIPDYQKEAVGNYLKNHKPSYSAAQYNNSGHARAIPDLSLNGAKYLTVLGGGLTTSDGTSAATPVLASMITLVNEARLSKGKKSLGFLNPAIYKNFDKFGKDVTEGANPGCGTEGFEAVEGWDPVTGLGTVDFEKMLKVLGEL